MNLKEFLLVGLEGMTPYKFAASFVIYSLLGWVVESIYMSICEKKVVNRGFARGPYCPIYGFGATVGSIFLAPFMKSFLLVYLLGAVFATIFEYLTGRLMIKTMGNLWWDYNDKPFNFKGILCLESTVAWGFYAIGVVEFLNVWLLKFIDSVDSQKMTIFIEIVIGIALIDYIIRFAEIFKEPLGKAKARVVDAYKNFRSR